MINFSFIDDFVKRLTGKKVAWIDIKYSENEFEYVAFDNKIVLSKRERLSDQEEKVISPYLEVHRRIGYLSKALFDRFGLDNFTDKKDRLNCSVSIGLIQDGKYPYKPLEKIVS